MNDPERLHYLVATASALPDNTHPDIGIMTSPRSRGSQGILAGRLWGMDCDAFSREGPNFEAQYAFMSKLRRYASTCLFVVVPDIPGDAKGTRIVWEHAARHHAEVGLPLAYVMHDDSESEDLPRDADVMFLGGTDPWRERWGAVMLQRAHDCGKPTHVGRVNSARRMRALGTLHARSADGTHLAFKGFEAGRRDVGHWLDGASHRLFPRSSIQATPIPQWALNTTRRRDLQNARAKEAARANAAPDPPTLFPVEASDD